ncbi:MAG: bacteriohemerythrin [Gammaproteobacteria bacterium]
MEEVKGNVVEDFIVWREDWRLGIELLDRQHQVLADCLNRLVRQCACTQEAQADEQPQARRRLGELLDELYTRAKRHFGNEEALMLEHGYPGYASHLQEHVMLLAELKTTFLNRFEQGCTHMDASVFKALKSWFIVHVIRSDRDFANYMLRREGH